MKRNGSVAIEWELGDSIMDKYDSIMDFCYGCQW